MKQEGRYSAGLAQGEHTFFREDGTIDLVIRYRDGAEVTVDGERLPPPFQPGGDQP